MNPISRLGYEYQVGGSLPINAPTYVRRQADEDFYSYLKKGEFCYVLNSRQMGKSSLRVQTMQRLENEGFACAAVDITAIGTADITPVEWYAGIIDYLVGCFNLDSDFELKSWWQENALLSPVQHFSKFIETVLLEQVEQNIIIFIDEIDSILSLQFNLDDFFAVIRDCYNRRASQNAYNRLTFALLGVSTPSNLIQDWKRTPFNIGRAIDLTGFQLSEAEPLVKGLARLGNSQELMKAVLDWTGGQPFLTQRICRLLLSETEGKGDKPFNYVEKLVQQRIIDNWEAQDEPEHLKTIRDRILLGFEKGKGRLLGLCQQILASNQEGIIADDSPEQTQLRLTGLVVRRDGRLKIYNRIYESVFNLVWVEQELAKLRPYSDAIDAWMVSNCEDESRLLRGSALKEAQQWAKGKQLSDLDYQFLAASQVLENRELYNRKESEKLEIKLALEKEVWAKERLKIGKDRAKKTLVKLNFLLTFLLALTVILLYKEYVDINRLANLEILTQQLSEGKFKEADKQTLYLILQMSDRNIQGWLRIEDYNKIPCSSLSLIDSLWYKHSKGRFGLSIQTRIWNEESQNFIKFAQRVGWRQTFEWLPYEKLTFNPTNLDRNIPIEGHLPAQVIRVKGDLEFRPSHSDGERSTYIPKWEDVAKEEKSKKMHESDDIQYSHFIRPIADGWNIFSRVKACNL